MVVVVVVRMRVREWNRVMLEVVEVVEVRVGEGRERVVVGVKKGEGDRVMLEVVEVVEVGVGEGRWVMVRIAEVKMREE